MTKNETSCACTGCVLQYSVNGEKPVPVTDGQGFRIVTIGHALAPDVPLAVLSFSFEPENGTCDPKEGCRQKTPCKVKDPIVAVETSANGATVQITAILGRVSPPPRQTYIPAGTVEVLAMGGVGGGGTPFVLALPCGGTPHSWRVRVESWDSSLGAMNAQEVLFTIICTACETV